jgi:hypothetical protein
MAKIPSVPDLDLARTKFANIGFMRELWDDSDMAIRVTSRSICALLARKVIREGRLEEAQLRWLQDVTREASNAIYNASTVNRDQINLKSFVYGVLSNQVGDLPTEDAMSFKETLVILLDARDDSSFQSHLSEEVGLWIQQDDDPRGSHEPVQEVVDKLRSMFPFLPTDPLPHPHARTSVPP